MSLLTNFFKESDTQLGVFYPNHYLIAVFRDLETAQQAVTRLLVAGFAEGEVIAAAGRDFVKLAEEEEHGVTHALMQAISRFFATEQLSHDRDLELAEHGAGIAAVHCPTEHAKQKAWSIIEAEAPLTARYYSNAGVEHLKGALTTHGPKSGAEIGGRNRGQ